VVLWLQGGKIICWIPFLYFTGPGASGTLGSFREFGPYKLVCDDDSDPKCTMSKRDPSWDEMVHLLIVD
jgi:carboxypeptidase C (cathepsin A)